VCMGGPVPARYFPSNGALADKDDENFITVTVPAGQDLKLEYEVLIPNSSLKWTCKTDGYDIGFLVTFQDKTEVIPYQRLDSHKLLVDNSIVCEKPGNYTLTFDNTYSKLRAKTLHYFITVVSPDGALIEDEDNLTEL